MGVSTVGRAAIDDGESTNSERTLDVRVAAVQNDVTHPVRRVDQVESSVVQTRDELKTGVNRIEEGLKSDMRGLKGN